MRYFIVTYFQKPGGKYNEQVKVDTKIRKKDADVASVIIDYQEKKIVKSRFRGEMGDNNNKDYDTINNFYKGHYPDVISQLEAKYIVLDELVAGVKEKLKEDAAEE